MVKNMENKKTKKIPYGLMAWRLNEIISGMNNEEAYYCNSWLFYWCDGMTQKQCVSEYDKEGYQELEKQFKKVYKAYHRDGLCNVSDVVLKRANEWDKKLNLPLINDVRKGTTPDYNDNLEKEILETIKNNGIRYNEIHEERDIDYPDEPYKVVYFYNSSDRNKAYELLNGKYQMVKKYTDWDGAQLLISE